MSIRRISAIALAAVMVFALTSGCGGTTAEPADSQKPSTPSPTITADPSEPGEQEEPGELYSIPLTEDKVTLTYWMSMQPFLMMYDVDMNNITYFVEMEKLTNVNIEITAVPMFTATEQFNIMMAGGEYTDLIEGFSSRYTGGADEAIEDGIIYDLLPHIEDGGMPNFKAALDENDEFWLESLTVGGSIAGANMLFTTSEGLTGGAAMRKDWLELVNMEVPTTIDELETYLKAIQVELGRSGLYYLYKSGVDANALLIAAFEAQGYVMDNDAPFLIKDGAVVYGPAEPGYKEYLKLMQRWFAEGLVNPDYATLDDRAMNDYIVQDNVAFSAAERGTFTYVETQSEGRVTLVGAPSMKLTEDQQLHVGKKAVTYIAGTAISSNCSDVDLAVRWLDFCYSDKATLLGNYGIEGEALTYDANGDPMLSDLVLHNPDGMDVIVCVAMYTRYGGPIKYYGDRMNIAYSDVVLDAIELWGKDNDMAWTPPTNLSFTAEVNSQYSGIMSAVQTYVAEFTNQSIMGQKDIDVEWDYYIDQLKLMGLDDAVGYYADAVDAYYAKRSYIS